MTALEASSAGVKDMADGSLRITMEFSPVCAKEAYALFGARGTPVAIAALKAGYAQQNDTSPEPVQKSAESVQIEKPKGGELAKLAGIWCGELEFREWLAQKYLDGIVLDEKGAANAVCNFCSIDSRVWLDHNPIAREAFNRTIRGPYMKHLQARGLI